MDFGLPNLPCQDLINGPIEDYLKFCVPLYKASIKCDWKCAKDIFDMKPELVRYAITENGETALHVSASTKVDKKTEEFVKNLVRLMDQHDLALQNKNHNTAFFVAAAAGNTSTSGEAGIISDHVAPPLTSTTKILMGRDRDLPTIPGEGGMMPLYVAAMNGYYDVVKYLYENSHSLSDDCWSLSTRGQLLEICVENDMFDIAQHILEAHPDLANNGNVLTLLACKPEKFSVRKTNFVWRIIIWVLMFFRLMKRYPEKENKALALLKTIWQTISHRPKNEIDKLLRGLPDIIPEKKSWSDQVSRLQLLIAEYISKMNVETNNMWQTESTNLGMRLQNLIFRHLSETQEETLKIISDNPKEFYVPLTGKKEYLAKELHKLISGHIKEMQNKTRDIIKSIQDDDKLAQKLREVIFECIEKLRTQAENIIPRDETEGKTYSSRVLFIAAEAGNTNFIVELIRQYPDLMWKTNDKNQTIFHIAVKNRHAAIFNLLNEVGSKKDTITTLKDEDGNNMLHLVALRSNKRNIWPVSLAGLQIQQEQLWFQEVRRVMPPSYRERKNLGNLTPLELFFKEHRDLILSDLEGTKAMAGQCMVVATLIATMGFTAAYTIPGGYNQNDGIPIFHSNTCYKIFVVADAISLLSSTTSILYMFVYIFLTSPYTEVNSFSYSPARKFTIGLLYLSISIISMLITFSVSFFILYDNGTLWMPILISVFALIPFSGSFNMYYRLLGSIVLFEKDTRNLFRRQKPVLFYENPLV